MCRILDYSVFFSHQSGFQLIIAPIFFYFSKSYLTRISLVLSTGMVGIGFMFFNANMTECNFGSNQIDGRLNIDFVSYSKS